MCVWVAFGISKDKITLRGEAPNCELDTVKVPFKRSLIYYDISNDTALTVSERE